MTLCIPCWGGSGAGRRCVWADGCLLRDLPAWFQGQQEMTAVSKGSCGKGCAV